MNQYKKNTIEDIEQEEAELRQELEIIKRSIRFVEETIKIIKHKEDLYNAIEEYNIDMLILKTYTSIVELYNNLNDIEKDKITEYLLEIGAYTIITLEKIEKMTGKTNGLPLHNKYESLISRIYMNKHASYNSKYRLEKTLTKQHITALMLMKAIRMKNLVYKITSNEIAATIIKDDVIDILIFAYIMYNTIA